MSDVKKCPACAEEVKAEAKICRHCGYGFETGMPAGTYVGPVPPKKRSIGKILGIVAAVFIGLTILGSIVGGGDPNAPTGGAEPAEAAQPPIKVTARELFAAYDANEAAAQAKYGGQRLEVAATVAGVDLDIGDTPIVLLRTQNEFQNAQASLIEVDQPKAAELTKGQSITLICEEVEEVIGTPILSECGIR